MIKLIIFEGVSGSGKSTLYARVRKLINHEALQVHRFTPTQWVYNVLYDRDWVNYEKLNTQLQEIMDVYVIWCDCSEDVAIQRQNYKDDPVTEDLVEARVLFSYYFRYISTFKKVLYLSTDEPVDKCMEQIKEFLYGKN